MTDLKTLTLGRRIQALRREQALTQDARYLMGGLPLASIDTPEGVKVRVDL